MSVSHEKTQPGSAGRAPSAPVLAPMLVWLVLSIVLYVAEPTRGEGRDGLEWLISFATVAVIVVAAATLRRAISRQTTWLLAVVLGIGQGLQSGMAWDAGGSGALVSLAIGASLTLVATLAFGSTLDWWHARGGREWALAHRRGGAPRWFLVGFIILALAAVIVGAVMASMDLP